MNLLESVAQLFIFLTLFSNLKAQKPSEEFTHCLKTHNFKYIKDDYMPFCIECESNYVLNFKLQECIRSDQLGLPHCKRLSRRYSCEEAECTLQVRSDDVIVSRLHGNPNENCAVFDKDTYDCILPRFGFSLNIDTKKITRDMIHMCAVTKGGECKEYFSYFVSFSLPFSNSPFSVYLIMDQQNLLDNVHSSFNEVKCLDGYVFWLNWFCYSHIQCKTFNLPQQCIECHIGYVLNVDQCQDTINNCAEYAMKNSIIVCILCTELFKLIDGQCVKLVNCMSQYKYNGNCRMCVQPYYGELCQNIGNKYYDFCASMNTSGICIECEDIRNQFFHIYEGTCQERKYSKQCKFPLGFSDSCQMDDYCQNGYYFDSTILETDFHFQSFQKYDQSELRYQILKYFLNKTSLWSWLPHSSIYDIEKYYLGLDLYYYKVYFHPDKYSFNEVCLPQIDIPHCTEYDRFYQSCSKCASGFRLTQRDDMLLDFFYRFICVDSSLALKIDHCIDSLDGVICQRCQDDYMVTTQHICERKIDYCMSQIGTKCDMCNNGYSLFNNQCFMLYCDQEIQRDQYNCQSCISTLDFPASIYDFSDESFVGFCGVPALNSKCYHYIDSICVECQQNYVLIQESKECVPETLIKDFCKVATSKFVCIECVTDYQLVNQTCVKMEKTCSLYLQCIDNCCQICDLSPSTLCSTYCIEVSASDQLLKPFQDNNSSNNNSNNNNSTLPIIIGTVCGGGIFLIFVGVFVYKSYLKKAKVKVNSEITQENSRKNVEKQEVNQEIKVGNPLIQIFKSQILGVNHEILEINQKISKESPQTQESNAQILKEKDSKLKVELNIKNFIEFNNFDNYLGEQQEQVQTQEQSVRQNANLSNQQENQHLKETFRKKRKQLNPLKVSKSQKEIIEKKLKELMQLEDLKQ